MPLAAFPKCFLHRMCVSREMSVDDWLDVSAGFDIDGLEFYWGFTPWREPAELERIRRRVERQGRAIPMMCYSPDFTKPDAADRRAEVEAQKNAIRVCPLLGVRYCRVLSGQRRPGISRQDGVRWVAQAIRELLPEAEKHSVTLILENHYKDSFWEFPEFAQKLDVFLEVLNAVGRHSSFGVNYDPSNAIIAGEDPIAVLEAVKDRVVTMHASDRFFDGTILQHGIVGRGLNDYDRIFGILKQAGFSGWISIEDGMDPETGARDIAESARFLRRKMAEHALA